MQEDLDKFYTIYCHYCYGSHREGLQFRGVKIGVTATEIAYYTVAYTRGQVMHLRTETGDWEITDQDTQDEFMMTLDDYMRGWHKYFVSNLQSLSYNDMNWPDCGATIRRLGVIS